jgi:hypothetical protein
VEFIPSDASTLDATNTPQRVHPILYQGNLCAWAKAGANVGDFLRSWWANLPGLAKLIYAFFGLVYGATLIGTVAKGSYAHALAGTIGVVLFVVLIEVGMTMAGQRRRD